ncbi:MAG: sodium-dependent transporter, partial [Micrococcus sp.]|nr:sodium-dependent transporter [Micrococcus sp.]
MLEKSQWGSKIGFILAAAGSAIGLGALWRFPYMTAEHGGGAFLLMFLLFTLV